LPRIWCNFCEEHHEEATSEVRKSARDKIFGKRTETTIIVLDFSKPEDVMIINTRNKSYAPKGKCDPPRNFLARFHPHQLLLFMFLNFLIVKELPPLSPLPNTIF
jgi:hypothetical protein